MLHTALVVRVFASSICLVMIGTSSSQSQDPSFQHIMDTDHTAFLAISSDKEATALFLEKFENIIKSLPGSHHKRKKLDPLHLPAEITGEISQFMAGLSTSLRAGRIQTFLQPIDVEKLEPLLNQDSAPYQWILGKRPSGRLTDFMELADAIRTLSKNTSIAPTSSPQTFEAFASHFDAAYPQLLGTPTSWVALLEKDGASGIYTRFNEYWNRESAIQSSLDVNAETLREDGEKNVRQYLKTRLLPVFVAHVVAGLVRVRADAEIEAKHTLARLAKWKQSQQSSQARNRLCGTWQWTVHNHQNHRDHKMTLSFLPPSQLRADQPQPDDMIIHGNTVYLKWKFPTGFQEDSLLLSNRDQRLEGTFTNSLGTRGTISGKRLTTCTP